jgi:hypothetical protein
LDGLTACLLIVASDEKFASEEHAVVTEGVADDVAPMGESKHESQGAVVVHSHDLATAGEHDLAAPSLERLPALM